MSLRILHVSPYYEAAWAYGGIPRVVAALTRAMHRQGHRVTVCTTDAHDDTSRLPVASTRGAAPEGPDVHVFPNASNRLAYGCQLFLPLGLRAFVRAHAADYDIAHVHACRNLPGSLAARALARAGVPYVLAPNGTAPRLERRRTAKALYDRLLGRRDLENAARLLAVTCAERRQLVALGVEEHRVHVVPNPVELEEHERPATPGAFRRRLGLGDGPLVLFLGRLSPRKRVDVLIRATASLSAGDSRLVIAGSDMGAGGTARRLVAALALGDRTRFCGVLRHRERLEALTDATVVVYPAEHEIFGLVPVEALLCGTPVIVAGDSGCGEVIGDVGGGLIVAPGDVSGLAAAIDAVLRNPGAWRSRVATAAPSVRARFGADTVASQVADLYHEILAS